MSAYNNMLLAQRGERRHFRHLHGYARTGRISDHHIEEWEALMAGQERERCNWAKRQFRIMLFFTAMFWRFQRDTGAPDSEALRRRFVEDCGRMQERDGETIDDLMQLFEETGYGT